ncbi:MAG: SGNH/GDSL hydrolase family protein [Proteobacteria bacterium]|nr:SGNH/GDSL hydrolase family protein [Pseudomonadota bacterium]
MRCVLLITVLLIFAPAHAEAAVHAGKEASSPFPVLNHRYVLMGLGDSLTQGTMDATDNGVNTLHAYLQKVYESLAKCEDVGFMQPLLSYNEKRLTPFSLPTNLGVDGSDIFSIEGMSYYKRQGAADSTLSRQYLCNGLVPWNLQDIYDNTLYPYNLFLAKPASQLDAAIWLLRQISRKGGSKALFVIWIGNNDSSSAALGFGTSNPVFVPLPLNLIADRLKPQVSALLEWAHGKGMVSFEPYTQASIERNLTELEDFSNQYEHMLGRLDREVGNLDETAEIFLCTLPYYSSVGYLFDSDDLEFYLRNLNPQYAVPPTFARVAESGQAITDYTRGDRIGLLTFMCMYALLGSGADIDMVNNVLETDGKQNDGLVLSEDEQRFIRARIDGFNSAIRQAAANRAGRVHLVDIAGWLNEILTGVQSFEVDGRRITRKWIRGNCFTIDGVHPGYTGQAIIANYFVDYINKALGMQAPLHDISATMAIDPYIDHDGDGWAPGPDYKAPQITQMLYLFKDSDDNDTSIFPHINNEIWFKLSDAILSLF